MIQKEIYLNIIKLKKLIVLSLFDGMSCGQIALKKLGFTENMYKYYASEIKSHAIKVTQHNFPNTIQLGDITKINYKNGVLSTEYDKFYIGRIDLVIGGSPCKGISRLNKNQEGLEHTESKLFWEYVRILNEVQTDNEEVKFLLENTHGKKEATQIISDTLRIEPISINSKLVSAQNRPRYYWTNIEDIIVPTDKNITTKDIFNFDGDLVSLNRVRWLNSQSGLNSVKRGYTKINPYPKSGCLTANGHKKWNENYLLKDGIYRYLSQTELEKLQTVTIGYTNILNYNEAYDVLGDGWTVDVIVEIFKPLIKNYL